MQATQDAVSLAPPHPPGMLRALLLALIAHALLLAALTWGVHWKQTESTAVEAEIWSSVTQQAAPREVVVEPPTPVPPPQPKPEPLPPPPPVPKVEQPAPAPVVRDADIALEREKKKREQEKQRQEDLLEKQQEEKREQLKKAAADKKKQEQKAKELEAQRQAQAEADAKRKAADAAAADAKRKTDAVQAQQQKAAEAARRAENLKRMQGLAGATGAATATGSALQSTGPSSSYAGKVSARVKPNIVFPDDIAGNPTADVEVRSSPDGTIISRRLVKSSGVKAWDDAVLKAIDKTETMPRDTDGRVPSPLIIGFSPKN